MPTNADRVLHFLQSIAPERATNGDIRARTGVKPHQQVFQITQRLMHQGKIKGRQVGSEWHFWTESTKAASQQPEPQTPRVKTVGEEQEPLSPSEFEGLARKVLGQHYGVELTSAKVSGVPKVFDLVSEATGHVGDAKYYTMVGGERLPPAKFSVIAEHVWLLEKTGAREQFLVFGNDRRVPMQWLDKYGGLVSGVTFYFLTDDGQLERLTTGSGG